MSSCSDEEYHFHEDDILNSPSAGRLLEAVLSVGGFQIRYSRDRSDSSRSDLSPIRKRSVSPEGRKGEVDILPFERFKCNANNYYAIAEKNAQELITEEEKAKLKAQKKRERKKKQKQKKKNSAEVDSANNQTHNDNATGSISNNMGKLIVNSDNKDAEGLDVSAAFVKKAIKKTKISPTIIPEKCISEKEKKIRILIKTALEYENKTHFKEAVQLISDAINLAPDRFDIFLKRSYLYYQLAKFEKSIRDAKNVLKLSPNNSDAYFRLGEAYFALKNLPGAEGAFTKLVHHNSYCVEANKRLISIRIKQLEEMGYHPNEAYTALFKSTNKTLEEAIEFLTELEKGKHVEELYYSDEEDDDEDNEDDEDEEKSDCASGPVNFSDINKKKPIIEITKNSPLLTDPSNPFGCRSLFVGNLKKDITYKEVHDVFSRFGDIQSIRITREPNCYAFVNYCDANPAGSAMKDLQGSRWLLSTVPIVIKFSPKEIETIIPTLENPELILEKIKPKPTVYPTPGKNFAVKGGVTRYPVVKPPELGKPRPAPKTEECFYWRTTGCTYGDKCFNIHIPEHKGIALCKRKPAMLC